jgi:hypothetical protein
MPVNVPQATSTLPSSSNPQEYYPSRSGTTTPVDRRRSGGIERVPSLKKMPKSIAAMMRIALKEKAERDKQEKDMG